MPLAVDGMKVCTRCKKNQPTDKYYKWGRSADGFSGWCKKCKVDEQKNASFERKEKHRKYYLTVRGAAIRMLGNARKNARDLGVRCSIDLNYVLPKVESMTCELTGWPLRLSEVRMDFYRPSLDRINPKGDYSTENVRVICWGINNMLGDYGAKKLLEAADAIRRNQYEG